MRRRHQGVCLDIVVGVSQIVGHETDHGKEDDHDQTQGEQILHHEVGPEGQRVLLGIFFRRPTHFNTGRIVVAGCVERPDMDGHQRRNDHRQQVVQ